VTPPRPRLSHDQRLVLLALGAVAPGAALALILLWTGDHTPRTQWTLTIAMLLIVGGFLGSLRARVIMPLQTVANLLSALREGDFSIRARGSRRADPLYDLHAEVNALAEMLRGQRLDSLEATALLRKVMAELDVAVFTFDERRRLQLVNHAGERLLGSPAERLLDRHAAELDMDHWLESDAPRIEPIALPGATGRWEVRHTPFRQRGLPHHLVVLTDVSKPLRDEERAAWQRLIRVLGHELNNSLAPIKSIAGSLGSLVQRNPKPEDWETDLGRGLGVIATRAEALSRFMSAYAQLARLPAPTPRAVHVSTLVERVVRLDTRRPVTIIGGPDLTIEADGDQIEQLVINLLKNASDAASETAGGISVEWSRVPGSLPPALELVVEDEGPGLSNTANLFVPFFTTKPGGSGIGLVLCRQIAEAHDGALTLGNREDVRGCRAVLRLPIGSPRAAGPSKADRIS
jgi:two-component system, NtrC family, nitrogen regulation sensor histidine kinase NtrY